MPQPAAGAARRDPVTGALDVLVGAAEGLAVILLVAMTVVVALAVYFRYVLDDSLVWYDEIASFLLVWLTFVGAVVVTRRRRHIGFELIVDRSPLRVRRALEVAAEGLVLVYELILVVYGWNLVASMGDETAVSLLWLQMGWIYAVIPTSAALMAMVTLRHLVSLLAAGLPRAAGPGGPGRTATE